MSLPARARPKGSPSDRVQPPRSIRELVRPEASGLAKVASLELRELPCPFWKAVGHEVLGRQGQSRDMHQVQGCQEVCLAPSPPRGMGFPGLAGYLELTLVSLVFQ